MIHVISASIAPTSIQFAKQLRGIAFTKTMPLSPKKSIYEFQFIKSRQGSPDKNKTQRENRKFSSRHYYGSHVGKASTWL